MRKVNKFFILMSIIVSASSFGDERPFKAVQGLFSAMSEVNHKDMKNFVTTDFQLLENGEDWDMNDLINVVKPSDYFRRNYFNVIRTEVTGNTAWLSYWNKATFTKGKLVEQVVWLESAILIKENHAWKIQMLHSTNIKPEKLPKNIELTEYKN